MVFKTHTTFCNKNKTMDRKDDLQIRSPKMRNIIGDIPKRLTTIGTAVIVTVAIILGICIFAIKINGNILFCLLLNLQ